jgi:4-diphosphocytidyl-2-C-methyl-D-erythritol kinase
MIEGFACAKVNLSLRVDAPRPDRLHLLHGLFQSILWLDRLELVGAEVDRLQSPQGAEVVDGWHNLAWQAVTMVRDQAAASDPMSLTLAKRIPVEAGLGGGSADAAAGLACAGEHFGIGGDDLAGFAPILGSDVPFCFAGGTAEVAGVGDRIRRRSTPGRYSLGFVVPPAVVPTAAAYRRWDELGGPRGFAVEGSSLPPELRDFGPLVNDLYPAAVDLEPVVEDWRSELADRWARPVMMTGSGPALFALFTDSEEAREAIRVVPPGARAVAATVPVPFGWVARVDDGPLFDANGPLEDAWARRIEDTAARDPVSSLEAPTIEDPSD